MTARRVRVGLVGAGVVGAVHAMALRGLAMAGLPVELVAVADPLPAQRETFTTFYGFERSFPDADALLAGSDVNAVFVCTPTRWHADVVHAAVARGCDVFCEKPLAMSWREGRDLVAAVEAAGVRAQIGLVLRFSAVYATMRELLAEPAAGEPLAVVFRDDQVFPIRGLHDSAWRADRTLTAGGTLIEHGVHDLDLLTWLLGPIATLRAWERNRAGHPGIEDYVAVEIEHASGVRASLVNVWHDMLQRPSNRRLEVFCRRAFVASEADMLGDVVVQRGDDAATTIPADEVLARFVARHHPAAPGALRAHLGVAYLAQDLAFVDALLAGRAPAPSLRDGLEAQRLAEAVYHAARTGTEVAVATFVPES